MLLHSKSLTNAGVAHAFTTRINGATLVYLHDQDQKAGEFNLGWTKHDEEANVRANRAALLKTIDDEASERFTLVAIQQRHTPVLRIIRDYDQPFTAENGRAVLRGDALATNLPDLLLAIQTADCIPVLVYDPKRRVVAAFHAGWRGTLARIVERGIGTLRLEYGCNPKDLIAAIGPGIGPESYSVGEEVRHEFESQFAYANELFTEVYDSNPVRDKYPMLFLTARAPGHSPIGPQIHLDLWKANHHQLLDAGLLEKNIDLLAEDTAANTDRYFSHRREEGFTGRMMSVIGLKAAPAKKKAKKKK